MSKKSNLKYLWDDPRFQPIKNVGIFSFLILSFHFFFRFWAYRLHYWPINDFINTVYEPLTQLLYDNSIWVLKHIFSFNFSFNIEKREIWYLPSNAHVVVTHGCSGLKQFLQWTVLMVFFPGPWKHKLWFIPTGLIIIHLVNIFRIAGLSIVLIYSLDNWHFIHDYVYRPFFYVVMFAMWVWWVEKINKLEDSSL